MADPIDLVDLEAAKAHLRVTTTAEDDDIGGKLEAATQVVVDYLTRAHDTDWNAAMAAWTADTVPRTVRAAILVQLGELYRLRGDDADAGRQGATADLSPTVKALLMRYRDPGFA